MDIITYGLCYETNDGYLIKESKSCVVIPYSLTYLEITFRFLPYETNLTGPLLMVKFSRIIKVIL